MKPYVGIFFRYPLQIAKFFMWTQLANGQSMCLNKVLHASADNTQLVHVLLGLHKVLLMDTGSKWTVHVFPGLNKFLHVEADG